MIPLSELRKAHKKREEEHAVACDAADDEICTAEDPSKCRVHGIRRYEREGDYLDKLSHASEDDEESRKKFNYFRDLANSMTMEEAEKELLSAFSVVVESVEDLKRKKSSLDKGQQLFISSMLGELQETDASTVAKTKKCVGATIRYLREKHGITLGAKVPFLAMRNKDESKLGAVFVSGGDVNSCFMAMSSVGVVHNRETFCHGDYRDDFDYARHELCHVLEYEKGIEDAAFNDAIVESLGEEKAEKVLKGVSKYAFVKRQQGEALAECFTKITSDDYDGSLDSIKQIVFGMVKGESK